MNRDRTRAIICACHAVYRGAGDILSDSSWVLQPFQAGEPRFYVDHLRRAVELTAADPCAVPGAVGRPDPGRSGS